MIARYNPPNYDGMQGLPRVQTAAFSEEKKEKLWTDLHQKGWYTKNQIKKMGRRIIKNADPVAWSSTQRGTQFYLWDIKDTTEKEKK